MMNGKHFIALFLIACGGPSEPVPASISVSAEPSRLYYHTDQPVIVRAEVLDLLGEEIEDVEVRWSVDPASGVSSETPLDDPRAVEYVLAAAGDVTFTGCIGDPEVDELCGSITLRVDDGMPSLEVESPLPGAELDDPAGIVVRGSVADGGVVMVYANGMAAPVDEMGRFELALAPQLGVNHLVVVASDGITEPSQVEMDVLWAPAYTPALGDDGQPSLTFDDGLALWLGQGFFDDEVPYDPSAATTRDLADLVELVVSSLDVSGLVPDPVVDSPPNFLLRVTGVELGAPHAEIDVTDDGADVFIRIGELRATTEGYLVVEDTSLPLTGTVTASVVAYAHLIVTKESEEMPLEVTVADDGFTVGIESAEGMFVSEETAAVFRLASGVLRTTLEDAFSDAVRSTIESSVPALLRDALNSVDGALADRTIPLAVEPFPPITIEIDGRIRTIESVFRREMLATMRTTVGTDTLSVHPESRGVVRWDTAAMTPDFFLGGSMALGVRMSLLNGLLHGLWSSGLLSIDVTPLLPEGVSGLVSEVRLNGRLPPILRPPRAGETDELVLSLGQLELDMIFMGEPVRFAITLDAGVAISVEDNRIALSIAETPRLTIWALIRPSNERLLTEETMEAILLDLWPDLRASVQDGLAFDLPLPGLGDLGGLAPSLSTFTLTLESTAPIRPRGDVLVLDAALVGSFPP